MNGMNIFFSLSHNVLLITIYSWLLILFGLFSSTNGIEIKCCPISRLKVAENTQAALVQVWLDIGPASVRLRDLWTVLPPSEVSAADLNAIRNACPDFTPGWLSDLVRVDIIHFFYSNPKGSQLCVLDSTTCGKWNIVI